MASLKTEFIRRFETANSNGIKTEEKTLRHSFNLYSTLRWKLGSFELDGGGQLLFNNLSKQLTLDARLKSLYKIASRYTLFGYAGRYSQQPKLNQVNPRLDSPNLRYPYTWQFGVGTEMRFSEFSLKTETYYKLFLDQTIDNVSFDEAFDPDEETNPRYLSEGEGRAYGFEFTLNRPFTKRFFGWMTYSLLKSERLDFAEAVDERDILNNTNNNGNDYKRLRKEYKPYIDDITHGFTTVLGFFAKPERFYLGMTFRLFSGKPHTPSILEEVEAEDGSRELRIVSSDELLSERLPLRYYLDVQFRWIWNVKKKRDYQISFFLDIPNIQFYWQQVNILDWDYPR